jgi:hypothetical protein
VADQSGAAWGDAAGAAERPHPGAHCTPLSCFRFTLFAFVSLCLLSFHCIASVSLYLLPVHFVCFRFTLFASGSLCLLSFHLFPLFRCFFRFTLPLLFQFVSWAPLGTAVYFFLFQLVLINELILFNLPAGIN